MNPAPQTDELTGALSRESFEPTFKMVLEQAAKVDAPLTLVASDIDHFLSINQNYGRDVGDEVLKTQYRLLRQHTPEEVMIFRYGGDEFYLIFPKTTHEQALLTMERIRLQVAMPRKYGDAEIEVALSAGIASYPIDSTASDELQRKVSQALYRAKKEGRSQVLLAYDEKMIPKTVHFTETQLERLSMLAVDLEVSEARLLREALDDLIQKYTVNRIET